MRDNLRDELEQLGIYQLRIYARKVGVKLATTLKKADLIESIINVLNGTQEPYVKNTKKGRPAKEYVKIDSQQDIPLAKMFANPIDYGIDPLMCPSEFDDVPNTAEKVKVSGLIDVFSNESGVIIPINGFGIYTYINEKLVKSNSIKRGDFVEGNAYNFGDTTVLVLYEVTKINGFDVDNRPQIAENNTKIPKTEMLEFNKDMEKTAQIFNLMDIKIKKGDKILISGKDRRMVTISTFCFLDILSNVKDSKIVLLGTGITDDFIHACKKYNNVECVGATFGESVGTTLKILELGLQYVNNLTQYTSSNIICVLLNIDNIINLCSDEEKSKWIVYFEKFILSAGNKNSGSLTIAYSITTDLNDNFYKGLETAVNVYLNSCDVVASKQLIVKFDWQTCYCNDLDNLTIDKESDYSYLLSNFLNIGKSCDRQQQIEYWVTSGLDKESIKDKMKEFIKNN